MFSTSPSKRTATSSLRPSSHHTPDLVDAQLRVEAGHIPPGARSQLVDVVFDLPNVPPGTRLEMTLPTGDGEMLEQIRNRCHDINTRVAGVSYRLQTNFPKD
jgi:hypothetical protein